MNLNGYYQNSQSLNGIISFDDGNGTHIENGQITTNSITTSNLNVNYLTVYDNEIIDGFLTVNEDISLLGNISVNKNCYVENILSVSGNVTMNNNCNIANNLSISGNATMNNNCNIANILSVSGNVTMNKNCNIANNLLVSGNVITENYFNSNNTINTSNHFISAGQFSCGDNGTIGKNLKIMKNLTVDGTANFKKINYNNFVGAYLNINNITIPLCQNIDNLAVCYTNLNLQSLINSLAFSIVVMPYYGIVFYNSSNVIIGSVLNNTSTPLYQTLNFTSQNCFKTILLSY